MDNSVLHNLTYGLYIVGATYNERPVGCVINTCFQVTSVNPILAISLNKNNFTLEAIKQSGKFSLSILAQESNSDVIGAFGFFSSKDTDKYKDFGCEMVNDVPIVKGVFAGRLFLEVIQMVDNETHVVVLARLVDTLKGEGTPMTYAYYHKVIKGKAPKNAPTYVEEPKEANDNFGKKYVCSVCGYVHETDQEMPDDFVCPLCKQGKSSFKEQ